MSNILHSCLEESEEVEQELLDVLLTPLLPSSKSENIAAYSLVGKVLSSCPVNVQSTISVFLNNVLVGAPSGVKGKDSGESELTDHIYPLIYELHKVSPELLLKVLPNICVQLQAEDESIRLKAVKLLGRLFASQYANYGTDFSRNFREFLGRFVDVSSQVRLEMVDCGSLIMKRKPLLREATVEHLTNRLKDPESEVRQNTLQHLLDIAVEDPTRLSAEAVQEMGGRVKDRKVEIRKVAMIGMSKMFNRHITAVLPELNELKDWRKRLQEPGVVGSGLLERLRCVPGLIINCWSYPEASVKHLVLSLLQEYLLPKSDRSGANAESMEDSEDSEEVPAPKGAKSKSKAGASKNDARDDSIDVDSRRCYALLLLLDILSEEEKQMLSTILGYKFKVRRELSNFLAAREQASSFQQDHRLKDCMARLLKELPVGDKREKGSQLLERLHVMKDKNVFKLLKRAVSPEDSVIGNIENRSDLKGRVDSKSALGEYVGRLYDSAAFMVIGENMAAHLLQLMAAAPAEVAAPVSGELDFITKHSSSVFDSCAEDLQDWITSARASKSRSSVRSVIKHAVNIISRASGGISSDEMCGELCKELVSVAKEETDAALCGRLSGLVLQLACCAEARRSGSKGSTKSKGKQSSSTPMDVASSALNHVCSHKKLSLVNKRLASDLMIAAGLLRSPLAMTTAPSGLASADVSAAYRGYIDSHMSSAKKIRSFVTAEVLTEDDAPDGIGAALTAWSESVASELQAEEVRVLEEKAQSQEGSQEMATDKEDEDDEVEVGEAEKAGDKDSDDFIAIKGASEDAQELVQTLFSTLESDGAKVGDVDVPTGQARLRAFEAAALCCLNLMKRPSIGRQLTTDAWKKLGWSLMHADEGVRGVLVEQLFLTLQTTSVHLRFLVYPLLLMTEPRYAPKAEHALFFNVMRLRRTHEVISAKAVASQSDSMQRKAQDNMPENVMPYVLYLLSYHPEFPTTTTVESESDRRKLRKMATIIRTAVRVLVETLPGEENNIAFLLKQVNMIQGHYEDRHDVENLGLHFVTRLTTKILNERVRTDDNVQEYRGDVHLPMELFRQRRDHVKPGLRGAAQDLIVNAVQEGMLEAETAIDRALAGKKGGGGGIFIGRGSVGTSRLSQGRRSSTTKGEGAGGGKDNKLKAARAPKRPKATVPEEEAERKMPRRGAKDSKVRYEDQDEDEAEVEEWERLAEEAQLEASFHKDKSGGSPSKPMLSAADSNAVSPNEDESDMDIDEDEGDEVKEAPKATKKKTVEESKRKSKAASKAATKASKSKKITGQVSITSFLGVGGSKENNDAGGANAKSKSKAPASKKIATGKSGTKKSTLLR